MICVGGSLTATVDDAATHLLHLLKTVSLNTAAVSSVTTQLTAALAAAAGTAVTGSQII